MTVWDIEEYKIWKGIDKEKPCWDSLKFACISYSHAEGLMNYVGGNKPDSVMRIVRRTPS